MATSNSTLETKRLTLLEQAKMRTLAVRKESISPAYREEVEVYVAWIMGEIDTADVARVLRIKAPSSIHQKAGTALRNCAKAGFLSVTWKD